MRPRRVPVTGARLRLSLLAGAAAAMWSLVIGVGLVVCLVMITWTVSPNATGDSGAAFRAAGLAWLGAHLVPLVISGGMVSVLPAGALLLGLALTRHGGRWAARFVGGASGWDCFGIVLGAALLYGSGGAGLAWLCSEGPATASPLAAATGTGSVAAAGCAWGVIAQARLLPHFRSSVGDATWRTLLGGVAAAVAILGTGAALVAIGLVNQFDQAAITLGQAHAGFLGTAVLTLINILSLPNLSVWAAGIAVGPGLHLGSVGYLTLWSGSTGELPGMAVLAAIPPELPAWAPALLVLPVLAGMLASRIRWGSDLPTLTGSILAAAGSAAVVAGILAIAAAVTSGSLAGGELSFVGVRAHEFAAAGAGLVALGMLLDSGWQSLHLMWRLYRAQARMALAQDRAKDPVSVDQPRQPSELAPSGAAPSGNP